MSNVLINVQNYCKELLKNKSFDSYTGWKGEFKIDLTFLKTKVKNFIT